MEGLKRNSIYVSNLLSKFTPKLLFLQETWLDHHETNLLLKEFPQYQFTTSSSDMFLTPEEVMLKSGPTWHGVAVGWPEKIKHLVTKLP